MPGMQSTSRKSTATIPQRAGITRLRQDEERQKQTNAQPRRMAMFDTRRSVARAAQKYPSHHSSSRIKVPRLNIGAVSIDTYSPPALVKELLNHALNGQVTRQIVTVNAQF